MKKILGISGSPRKNRITEQAMKEILSHCEAETEFLSLAGKKISGCISCLGCTKNNVCVIKDDFPAIAEKMVEADAIVLGVPNYYDVPNVLTHALLERCFCFRHQGAFQLQDKPIVIFSTRYSDDEENSPVLKVVDYFAYHNKVNVVSKFLVGGFSQCYTCKYSKTCIDGNVVKNYGVVDKITPDMLPPEFDKQPKSIAKCQNAAKLLMQALNNVERR